MSDKTVCFTDEQLEALRDGPAITDLRSQLAAAREECERLKTELAEWKHRAVGGTCRILSDPKCDCSLCKRDAENERLKAEIQAAMKVLAPNVPESGIEDAARQVKQVAITAMDNSEQFKRRLAEAERVLREYANSKRCYDKACAYFKARQGGEVKS